jgi:hypothetical protein
LKKGRKDFYLRRAAPAKVFLLLFLQKKKSFFRGLSVGFMHWHFAVQLGKAVPEKERFR